jgi:hypothetical protein
MSVEDFVKLGKDEGKRYLLDDIPEELAPILGSEKLRNLPYGIKE